MQQKKKKKKIEKKIGKQQQQLCSTNIVKFNQNVCTILLKTTPTTTM